MINTLQQPNSSHIRRCGQYWDYRLALVRLQCYFMDYCVPMHNERSENSGESRVFHSDLSVFCPFRAFDSRTHLARRLGRGVILHLPAMASTYKLKGKWNTNLYTVLYHFQSYLLQSILKLSFIRILVEPQYNGELCILLKISIAFRRPLYYT